MFVPRTVSEWDKTDYGRAHREHYCRAADHQRKQSAACEWLFAVFGARSKNTTPPWIYYVHIYIYMEDIWTIDHPTRIHIHSNHPTFIQQCCALRLNTLSIRNTNQSVPNTFSAAFREVASKLFIPRYMYIYIYVMDIADVLLEAFWRSSLVDWIYRTQRYARHDVAIGTIDKNARAQQHLTITCGGGI